MNGYPVIAFFVGVTGIYFAVATPAFKLAGTPPNPSGNRISSIDGLRGFLALAVFFHHAAFYRNLLTTGNWSSPSTVYFQLGGSGVGGFFMITAYLFWSRLLRTGGKLEFRNFYIGRIFRIGPLYLFTVLIMFAIIMAHTGLHLEVPVIHLAREITAWLALGFAWHRPDINHFQHTSRIVCGVVWTLHYEWLFYFALPAIAYLARRRSPHLPFLAFAWLGCLIFLVLNLGKFNNVDMVRAYVIAFFLSGMLCGSLANIKPSLKVSDIWSSTMITLLILLDFDLCHTAYHPGSVFILSICFYLIISGSTIFGLLLTKASRRLGDISYGIYLLQGLVLHTAFTLQAVRQVALAGPIRYWAVIIAAGLILVSVATLTHAAIERPGIVLGKYVTRRLTLARHPQSVAGEVTP